MQIENIDLSFQKNGAAENPVGGAINVVLPHPTNFNILFVGGVNGGVWRTLNATAAVQDWEPITDFESSLSIGAMAFDAADPSGNTLIVGIGRNSSLRYEGGGLNGLLKTTEALADHPDFTAIGDPLLGGNLADVNISGLAVNGDVIVIASNNYAGSGSPGIRRSKDGGETFDLLSNNVTSKLPDGPAFDLVVDPGNPDRLYAGIGRLNGMSEFGGIFRSINVLGPEGPNDGKGRV